MLETLVLYIRVYGDRFVRYPGIFEIIAGIVAGVGWTLLGTVSSVDLPERPGYTVLTYFVNQGWVWQWAGAALAAFHTVAIFTGNRTRRINRRAYACLSSLVFWCLISYGAIWSALLAGRPVPMLVIPGLILAAIHLVLMIRLWKGVE